MNNYKKLQNLYGLAEIQQSCVDIDFCYAFICAMASSDLELQQWMPLLFISEESHFSNEEIATDFAQTVLALYQQTQQVFSENIPLLFSISSNENATRQFAYGYLQALMMIDNLQVASFPEGSELGNLQQTCLLLLDKMATAETEDAQKLALFAQLPKNSEIIALLPTLLSHYGHLCLTVSTA